MSMFDGILDNIDDVAAKLGLPADKAQAFADTVKSKLDSGGDQVASLAAAAKEHGISAEGLQSLAGNLGEGAQDMLGKAVSFFDKDGDGNVLDDLSGAVKGLFGKS